MSTASSSIGRARLRFGAMLAALAVSAMMIVGCGSDDGGDDGDDTGNNGGNPAAVPGATLEAKFLWLKTNAQSSADYTLEVNADEAITAKTLDAANLNGSSAVKITLVGIGAERAVSLSGGGPLFNIQSGDTLVLGNNVSLTQGSGDNGSLVIVEEGGALIMEDGASVTGVTNNSVWGGAVQVWGTFTMNGGEISDNNGHYGGGVAVYGGTFTMNGGSITDNTVSDGAINRGGGVYIDGDKGGTFTMTGGTISDNKADGGGGVYLGKGTFTMTGGAISGNQAGEAGGVLVGSGTFTMSGGVISGNTAGMGGGLFIGVNGTFNKTAAGGIVYGSDADASLKNTATDSGSDNKAGHAVYVYGGRYGSGWRNSTVTANEALSVANQELGAGTWGD